MEMKEDNVLRSIKLLEDEILFNQFGSPISKKRLLKRLKEIKSTVVEERVNYKNFIFSKGYYVEYMNFIEEIEKNEKLDNRRQT